MKSSKQKVKSFKYGIFILRFSLFILVPHEYLSYICIGKFIQNMADNAITSKVIYTGGLRTSAVHLKSGNTIITDAPPDNHGKGEAFSPTDLMATSLANCMLTVMGIACQSRNINIDGTVAEVTKIMAANPRRVAEIHITLTFPPMGYTDEQKKLLELTARTCPVAESLHPKLIQNITFVFN